MYNITNEGQVSQSLGWIVDDLLNMIKPDADLYEIAWAIGDIVHLENMLKDGWGYSPDVIGDFEIGL